jgi:hypothetical protein
MGIYFDSYRVAPPRRGMQSFFDWVRKEVEPTDVRALCNRMSDEGKSPATVYAGRVREERCHKVVAFPFAESVLNLSYSDSTPGRRPDLNL